MSPAARWSTSGVVALAALSLSALCGCKPDSAVHDAQRLDQRGDRAPEVPVGPAAASSGSAQTGALTGAVLFRGVPPPRARLTVNNGHVARAYVSLRCFPAEQSAPRPAPRILTPQGCVDAPGSGSPYAATTGPDGRFDLRGLPAGTYLLAVAQEQLGEQEIQVTVLPRATGVVNVTFGH